MLYIHHIHYPYAFHGYREFLSILVSYASLDVMTIYLWM